MATLKERIDADLKDAMRSKNELTLSVLRMLKSAVKYKEVEPGASALDDAGILTVIAGLIKQRRDSVEQFKSAAARSWRRRKRPKSASSRTTCPSS